MLVPRALVVLVALLSPLPPDAVRGDDGVARGRRLYRDGILPSGEPLRATVAGDVPVAGAQVACVNCHGRSGLGSSEGRSAVPPVAAPTLFRPAEGRYPRPAYTDDAVGRALREGVGAGGRTLDPLMPRYRIGDADLTALASYLRTLAAAPSPGISDTAVRLATVIGEDVPPAKRQAMLGVLETYVLDKNSETRNETRRRRAPTRVDGGETYRQWVVEPWTVGGPPDTWAEQLERRYRAAPVFAMVGGLVTGEWRPIHEFCERHALPCFLPNTDLPFVDARADYTVYASKGLVAEAQALAMHLVQQATHARVLQAYRPGPAGETPAGVLRAALAAKGPATVVDVVGPPAGPFTADALAAHVRELRPTAIVLWLAADDLAGLAQPGWRPRATPLYLSSSLLDADLAAIPPPMRAGSFAMHPFTLPAELPVRLRRLDAWLRSRRLAPADRRIQAQTYFACLVAAEGLVHLQRNPFRDYLLDRLDHLSAQAALATFHARASFGPRQRYLSKGSYLLELGGDPERPVLRHAWIALDPS